MSAVPARFDEEVHAPLRLQLCSALLPVRSATFPALREALGVSDSVLSKHLSRLQAVGYVAIDKRAVGGRSRTSAALTEAGRVAVRGHLTALREIAAAAEAVEEPAQATILDR
ncbi:transcriptional regulator [Cellulomonas sp. NPDC089187]|uniref:transcriptional regulator n=1 Tax=Cellulomonas sp. NPDC089187 TaxID=3154970 RepID=UPI003425F618